MAGHLDMFCLGHYWHTGMTQSKTRPSSCCMSAWLYACDTDFEMQRCLIESTGDWQKLWQQLDSKCIGYAAAELLLPAITRVVGIIGGVLLSLLLSVLLWPKSASEQAMRCGQTPVLHVSVVWAAYKCFGTDTCHMYSASFHVIICCTTRHLSVLV